MSTVAAVAIMGFLTGYALGWVGRFALFAVALLAIVAGASAVALLGSRPLGEIALLSVTVLLALQAGYAARLLQGAAAIARRRRSRGAPVPQEGEDKADPRPVPPAIERYR